MPGSSVEGLLDLFFFPWASSGWFLAPVNKATPIGSCSGHSSSSFGFSIFSCFLFSLRSRLAAVSFVGHARRPPAMVFLPFSVWNVFPPFYFSDRKTPGPPHLSFAPYSLADLSLPPGKYLTVKAPCSELCPSNTLSGAFFGPEYPFQTPSGGQPPFLPFPPPPARSIDQAGGRFSTRPPFLFLSAGIFHADGSYGRGPSPVPRVA